MTTLLDPSLKGSLPSDFLHGYASASYQIEGGYDQGGRGLTMWDVALKDKENGNDACDSYHLWEKDVELLVKYGATAYRFSIAWSRIIPKGESSIDASRQSTRLTLGGKDDPVNQEGIDYYSRLVGLHRTKLTLDRRAHRKQHQATRHSISLGHAPRSGRKIRRVPSWTEGSGRVFRRL